MFNIFVVQAMGSIPLERELRGMLDKLATYHNQLLMLYEDPDESVSRRIVQADRCCQC